MKKVILILLVCLICNLGYGQKIPAPPVIKDKAIYEYIRTLYDNYNQLEIVTSDPDGNRRGRYGDIVVYYDSTNYYFYLCVSSPYGTTWKKVQLN